MEPPRAFALTASWPGPPFLRCPRGSLLHLLRGFEKPQLLREAPWTTVTSSPQPPSLCASLLCAWFPVAPEICEISMSLVPLPRRRQASRGPRSFFLLFFTVLASAPAPSRACNTCIHRANKPAHHGRGARPWRIPEDLVREWRTEGTQRQRGVGQCLGRRDGKKGLEEEER